MRNNNNHGAKQCIEDKSLCVSHVYADVDYRYIEYPREKAQETSFSARPRGGEGNRWEGDFLSIIYPFILFACYLLSSEYKLNHNSLKM